MYIHSRKKKCLCSSIFGEVDGVQKYPVKGKLYGCGSNNINRRKQHLFETYTNNTRM